MDSKVIEVKEDDVDKEKNEYKSCCMIVDKRAVRFFSQLTISLITIFFSIYQLSTSESCERDSLYSGMLTLVLGCWLPQPSMTKI